MLLQNEMPMPDGGPQYSETNFNLYFVEPYNTVTAFLFVILGLYWVVRLSDQIKTHTFLFWISLLLLAGASGGTAYHGFRAYPIFLLLDWVPILLVVLSAIYYFLFLVLKKHAQVIPVFIVLFIFQGIGRKYGPVGNNLSISINYMVMVSSVILPLFFYLYKTNFKDAKWVLISLLSFCLAIGFRMVDQDGLLPMGTHFLWHIFGAIATHSMFWFLYEIKRVN